MKLFLFVSEGALDSSFRKAHANWEEHMKGATVPKQTLKSAEAKMKQSKHMLSTVKCAAQGCGGQGQINCGEQTLTSNKQGAAQGRGGQGQTNHSEPARGRGGRDDICVAKTEATDKSARQNVAKNGNVENAMNVAKTETANK